MIFTAVDQVSGPLKSIFAGISKTYPAVGELIKKFKALAITGALLFGVITAGSALFSPMVANAGNYEEALTTLGNTSQATAEELDLFNKKALDLGVATEWSPKEAVAGMNELAAAGLNVQQNLQAIEPTLNAATAGKLDLAQAARTVAGGLNAFGKDAAEAGQIVDVYTRATQIAPLYLKDFESAIGQVGAKAHLSNQSLHETVAVLGAVRKTGMSANESATRIKSFLTQVVQNQDKFAGLGVSIRDASGQLLPMTSIVENLGKRLSTMGKAQQDATLQQLLASEGMDVYGAVMAATFKQTKDGREITLKGVDAVRAMRGELLDSTGTAKAFADANKATWNGLKKMFSGTMETISIVLGMTFLPYLKVAITWVTTFANTLLQWMMENEAAVQSFGKWAIIIGGGIAALVAFGGAIQVVRIGLGLAVGPFFGLARWIIRLIPLFAMLTIKTVLFTAALLTNPITWVVLGIVALGAAIAGLIIYWDEVKAAVTNFVNSIPDGLLAPLTLFAPFIGLPLLIIKKWDAITDFFKGLPDKIMEAVTSLPDVGGKLIDTVINGIKAKSKALYDTLKETLGPLGRLLPQSDAKEEPLSSLSVSGKKLVTTMAAGVMVATPALADAVKTSFVLPEIRQERFEPEAGQGFDITREMERKETVRRVEGGGERKVSVHIEQLILPEVKDGDDFIAFLMKFEEEEDS